MTGLDFPGYGCPGRVPNPYAQQAPYGQQPGDVEISMSPESSEVLYHDGRLFMSEVFASDFGSSSGVKECLAIAFGAR